MLLVLPEGKNGSSDALQNGQICEVKGTCELKESSSPVIIQADSTVSSTLNTSPITNNGVTKSSSCHYCEKNNDTDTDTISSSNHSANTSTLISPLTNSTIPSIHTSNTSSSNSKSSSTSSDNDLKITSGQPYPSQSIFSPQSQDQLKNSVPLENCAYSPLILEKNGGVLPKDIIGTVLSPPALQNGDIKLAKKRRKRRKYPYSFSRTPRRKKPELSVKIVSIVTANSMSTTDDEGWLYPLGEQVSSTTSNGKMGRDIKKSPSPELVKTVEQLIASEEKEAGIVEEIYCSPTTMLKKADNCVHSLVSSNVVVKGLSEDLRALSNKFRTETSPCSFPEVRGGKSRHEEKTVQDLSPNLAPVKVEVDEKEEASVIEDEKTMKAPKRKSKKRKSHVKLMETVATPTITNDSVQG